MTTFQQGIISLTRAAVTGERTELPDGFLLERIDAFAKKHQISSIMLYGIVTLGLSSSHPAINNLYVRSSAEIVHNEKQLSSIELIRTSFTKNSISFLLLKGAFLKKMYPKPEMRTMGDIDLLIKDSEYPKIKAILTDNGFTEQYESDHEYAWRSPSGLLMELHKSLIPSYYDDYYSYFGDGWSRAVRCPDSSEYLFSPEDHFIYIFAHFAKHYKSGGIGIKHLCDLWLYKKFYSDLDIDYIKSELDKIELLTFYNNVSDTEKVWFEGAVSNRITDKITETVIKSGAFGQHEDRVTANNLRLTRTDGLNKASKLHIIFKTVFPSAKVLSVRYKFLRKCKLLLPIAWLVRWIDAIFNKRESIKRQASDIKSISEDKILKIETELSLVGLKYHTKEKK